MGRARLPVPGWGRGCGDGSTQLQALMLLASLQAQWLPFAAPSSLQNPVHPSLAHVQVVPSLAVPLKAVRFHVALGSTWALSADVVARLPFHP